MNRQINWIPKVKSEKTYGADGSTANFSDLTPAEVQNRIAAIDAQITTKNRLIAELKESAREWLRQGQIACTGYAFKKQLDACKLDRTNKTNTGNARNADADNIAAEVKQLISTKIALQQVQQSYNTSNESLAQQGTSQTALIIKAQGDAEAAKNQAKIIADAKAQAIAAESTAKAKEITTSAFTKKTIIIMVVLTVIVVTSLILVKRFRNKKAKAGKPGSTGAPAPASK